MNNYQVAHDILPPDKRTSTIEAFLFGLVSPIQWLHDMFFTSYNLGSDVSEYVAGTYSYLDQVKYNRKVYVSLIDNNTSAPTDTNNWYMCQSFERGMIERKNIDGNKLKLEYALNKYFKTTFLPPPYQSQIYISNTTNIFGNFFVALTEEHSSEVGLTEGKNYIGDSGISVTSDNFTIFVPTGAATELDIRAFANQYVPTSLTYTVTFY